MNGLRINTLHLPLKQEASFIRRYRWLHHGHHTEPERRDLQVRHQRDIFDVCAVLFVLCVGRMAVWC